MVLQKPAQMSNEEAADFLIHENWWPVEEDIPPKLLAVITMAIEALRRQHSANE